MGYIFEKHITIVCGKNDKYGRTLANMYVDGIDVCNEMLSSGLVLPYAGKKKLSHL